MLRKWFEFTKMMEFDETMAIEDENDLSGLIKKFIRLRECNQFQHSLSRKNFCDKSCVSLKDRLSMILKKPATTSGMECGSQQADLNGLNYEDDDDDDEEENDYCDDKPSRQIRSLNTVSLPYKWQIVWNKINIQLAELKRNEIDEYLGYYTKILQLHVEHRVKLHLKCFNALLNCVEPVYVRQIFDLDLVSSAHIRHVECIYEGGTLFSALQLGLYTNNAKEPFYVIGSLTVLLYMTKCHRQRAKIVESTEKRLMLFLNRRQYDEQFRKLGVKNYFKALMLNGLLSLNDLGKLLKSSQRTGGHAHRAAVVNRRRNDDDNSDTTSDEDDLGDEDDVEDMDDDLDDDSEVFSDSSMDNSESDADSDGVVVDIGQLIHQHHHQHRIRHRAERNVVVDQNNNQPNNNQPNNQPNNNLRTISELINLKENEIAVNFPLSLKNLTRIAIKNAMTDYTYKNVNKFHILPSALKSFLMFTDEIDQIIKQCNAISNAKMVTNANITN